MEDTVSPTYDANQVLHTQNILTLERQIKSGMSWFYWIAGLSILNTIIYAFGGTLNFVVGLSFTQFIDGFTKALAGEFTGSFALIIQIIGFAMDAMIAGIFLVFGILGNKKTKWAIVSGMILYLIDGLLYLGFGVWLSVIFHGLALSGLWGGLKAIKDLGAFESSLAPEQLTSLRTSLASTQPAQKPTEPISFSRVAKIVATLVVAIIIFTFLLIVIISALT